MVTARIKGKYCLYNIIQYQSRRGIPVPTLPLYGDFAYCIIANDNSVYKKKTKQSESSPKQTFYRIFFKT